MKACTIFSNRVHLERLLMIALSRSANWKVTNTILIVAREFPVELANLSDFKLVEYNCNISALSKSLSV